MRMFFSSWASGRGDACLNAVAGFARVAGAVRALAGGTILVAAYPRPRARQVKDAAMRQLVT